uniref:Aldose 1-epimerase n=1 Tax=Solibacter usitatus (strain Ellin6076) TaxID=234267 RepID=Q01WL0_SOLUE
MRDYAVVRQPLDGIDVVRLVDSSRNVEFAIAPAIGNTAFEWKVRDRNYLYFPYTDGISEFARKPKFCGVPFLAPWANRIQGDSYWANGKHYLLNAGLGNLNLDGNKNPIHGLLTYSDLWKVAEARADNRSAWLTSRLEFWKHPDLMAQFPFPHTLTMTYRLREGVVEVQTTIENHGAAPMPVGVGYHPYFRLHDVHRDEWHVHLAARDHLTLNAQLIPTGESRPIEFADPHSLSSGQLDDVFGNLVRGADGLARFYVEGGRERITVTYGPKYTVAVVYAPKGEDFICFEPMAAITNAFNLAHAGLYKGLQSIPPAASWTESFWLAAA